MLNKAECLESKGQEFKSKEVDTFHVTLKSEEYIDLHSQHDFSINNNKSDLSENGVSEISSF